MAKLPSHFEIIGHRGQAGNLPENSLAGFLGAVQLGVDAIELDVVVSANHKLVVSHEAYMAADYMLDPYGNRILREKEQSYNLYNMEYDLIKKFDSGLGRNIRFPRQKKLAACKPLLSDLIDSLENYITTNDLPKVKYYVEIKSEKEFYGKFQPYPQEFVALVLQLIEEKNFWDRLVLKSFDTKILEQLHLKRPDMPLSYLVFQGNPEENLNLLSFQPTVYSPYYKILNKEDLALLHEKKLKVIPWTVNEPAAMRRMINLGVDGIISDYPQRLLALRN